MLNLVFQLDQKEACIMTTIYSRDSSPEEQKQFMNGIKDLMQLFKTNPNAADLLKEAQSGNLSGEQFMIELIKLQSTEK